MYCCAAQGRPSALQAETGSSPTSPSSSSTPVPFTQHAFIALAVVCAFNTVAIVVLLVCWVRRHQSMRGDDVISVASEDTSETNPTES